MKRVLGPHSGIGQDDIGVLQVCRAMRRETLPVFYGTNIFKFDSDLAFEGARGCAWLESLAQSSVGSLQRIHIQVFVFCRCEHRVLKKHPEWREKCQADWLERYTKLTIWIDRTPKTRKATCVVDFHKRNQSQCQPVEHTQHEILRVLNSIDLGSETKGLNKEHLTALIALLRQHGQYEELKFESERKSLVWR